PAALAEAAEARPEEAGVRPPHPDGGRSPRDREGALGTDSLTEQHRKLPSRQWVEALNLERHRSAVARLRHVDREGHRDPWCDVEPRLSRYVDCRRRDVARDDRQRIRPSGSTA